MLGSLGIGQNQLLVLTRSKKKLRAHQMIALNKLS
jgi:hypothetical protein